LFIRISDVGKWFSHVKLVPCHIQMVQVPSSLVAHYTSQPSLDCPWTCSTFQPALSIQMEISKVRVLLFLRRAIHPCQKQWEPPNIKGIEFPCNEWEVAASWSEWRDPAFVQWIALYFTNSNQDRSLFPAHKIWERNRLPSHNWFKPHY
jgi:hypothetical protein